MQTRELIGKKKLYQPKILCLAVLSFKSEGETRAFSDNQKLREFVASRPALQGMLEVLREFPEGPVVRTWCFHCRGPGSIPGQGTKILRAADRKSVV